MSTTRKGIEVGKLHAQAHITMGQAIARYHLRYDRFGWSSGMLRMGKYGFYYLPRWVDNVQFLGEHLVLRARRRCIQCRMPDGIHKLDCYHNWRIRDDLLQLVPRYHAWLVRREEGEPEEGERLVDVVLRRRREERGNEEQ